MATTIQTFVLCLSLGVYCSHSIPFVSGNFLSWLFASKQDNAFTTLNDYLVDSTKSADFQDNVQSARYLVEHDKFNSIIKKQQPNSGIVSDEFKQLANSLARLSDERQSLMGRRNKGLCAAWNLNRLRNMTEVMHRNIETTSESLNKLRLANLIVQVAKAAGNVCFARLEHRWFTLKKRNSLPVDPELSNYARVQTGFMLFANLCQKYQNKRSLEQDDLFLESAEYSLKNTAKLRPDIVEGAALVFKSQSQRPSVETIANLVQKVLLEPCREMYAVRVLADTIKPIADLLISLVVVEPDDYFDNYIDGLPGEIKDWTARFVMCEWLLDADLTRLSRALWRNGRWK